jgi:hypothetical protein
VSSVRRRGRLTKLVEVERRRVAAREAEVAAAMLAEAAARGRAQEEHDRVVACDDLHRRAATLGELEEASAHGAAMRTRYARALREIDDARAQVKAARERLLEAKLAEERIAAVVDRMKAQERALAERAAQREADEHAAKGARGAA